MNNVLIRLINSPIIITICFLINLFNYYILIIVVIALYYDITVDVEAYISKYHIHQGVGAGMFFGAFLGPVISLVLSSITCFVMSRRGVKGRIIIFSVNFLLATLFILS